LVGQSIGRGSPGLAKDWVRYILRVALWVSVVMGAFFAVSSAALSMLFPEVSPEVLATTTIGIFISAAFQPLAVRMLMYAALLPNGNDTTGIIIGDLAGPYLVGLPVSILLAFFTPLGVLGVMVGKGLEDTLKMLIFGWRSRRVAWDRVVQKHEDSLITPGDIRTGPITL